MMLPDFCSTMCLPKTWQDSTTPFKFTVMMRSNSSSGMSKNGVGEFTPAPFTKMSTRLNFFSTSASSCCRPDLEVVSHEKNSAFPPPLGNFVKPRRRLGRVAPDERDGCARRRHALGHFAAQHARAADDDRHFVFE